MTFNTLGLISPELVDFTTHTFIIQPPLEDNLIREHEGDCFSVTSSESECFTLSSTEGDCFAIANDTKTDEYPFAEDVDLEPFGFKTIKCVQNLGQYSIAVIGEYKPPLASDEIEVIAKISYNPSVSGGIGKINGVTQFRALSYFGLTDYTKIDRLDGWDVKSNSSSICIVYDDNVYWLDTKYLTLDSKDTTHPQQVAKDDCYFNENTYNIPLSDPNYLRNINTPAECIPDGVCRSWEGSESQPDPGDPRCNGLTTGGIGDYGDTSGWDEKNAYGQLSGGVIETTQVTRMRTTPATDNSVEYAIMRQRKGLYMTTGGEVIQSDSVSPNTVWCENYIYPVGIYWSISYGTFSGAIINQAEATLPLPRLTDSGVKLAYDGRYAIVYDDTPGATKMKFADFTDDTTGELTVLSKHFTLSHGVLIQANGTKKLKQSLMTDL